MSCSQYYIMGAHLPKAVTLTSSLSDQNVFDVESGSGAG